MKKLYLSLFLMCVPAITAQADITTGLVGYWNFDEGSGTTATDSSGNGNNGTLVNGPAWTLNESGYALSFDGSSNYVDVADASDLNMGTGSFTVSVWVKPNSSLGSYYQIIGKKAGFNGSNVGWSFWLDFRASGVLELRVNDGSADSDLTPTATSNLSTLLDGSSWVNVVMVVNVGDNVTFYANGQNEGTVSIAGMTGSISNTQAVNIGGQYYFPGSVDDVRIYNRALSSTDVGQLYAEHSAINGLVGWWTFDEGSGTTAHDSSGQNQNGTLVNSPTWQAGKDGQALDFNGTNQYVTMGANSLTGTSPYTISAWFKGVGAAGGYGVGLVIGYGQSGEMAYVGWVQSAQVGTSNSYGGGGYARNYGSGVTDQTKYHLVVLTSSGGATQTITIYVDGVQTNQHTETFNIASNVIRVGTGDDSGSLNYYFQGGIDDARIYNRALSAAEVAALYKDSNGPSLSSIGSITGVGSVKD